MHYSREAMSVVCLSGIGNMGINRGGVGEDCSL